MKVNTANMEKLRCLYYNLTGEKPVFDDYCFFRMWNADCTFIQAFWNLKKEIDKLLKNGTKPTYKLFNLGKQEMLPFETVNGYYQF